MKYWYFIIALAAVIVLSNCKEVITDGGCFIVPPGITVNEVQFIGSHNSYRKQTYQPLYDWVLNLAPLLPPEYNPEGWDYDHLPLEEQLESYRLRSLELDVFYDPQGGHFYERKGLAFIGEPVSSGISELLEPGFKLIHIPDFDYETHHISFKEALTAIKAWSDVAAGHLPIFILVEPKEQTVESILPALDLTASIPFSPQAMDELDDEIRSVFGQDLENVFTPDDLRGAFSSVNEAALNGAWPGLYTNKGRFFFILDGLKDVYLDNHPGLEGRVMFVFSEPGNEETAFVKINDPFGNESQIQSLVEQGYIVRTRADADTEQARTGDVTRMNAAFFSGAQIISTDYYRADPRADTSSVWSHYSVKFPDGRTVRYNPVNTTEEEQECDHL